MAHICQNYSSAVRPLSDESVDDLDAPDPQKRRVGYVAGALVNAQTVPFNLANVRQIMWQSTGHRDPKVLEVYAREFAPLVGNAVLKLDL